MTVKVHEPTRTQRRVIDLTRVPYFPSEPEPLVLQEASGLERVRGVVEETPPTYRIDRYPHPEGDTLFFGGLGLAAVMDVSAHPIRAKARRIHVGAIFAITSVLVVATIITTIVASFRY